MQISPEPEIRKKAAYNVLAIDFKGQLLSSLMFSIPSLGNWLVLKLTPKLIAP
jgi:hypothetical protein